MKKAHLLLFLIITACSSNKYLSKEEFCKKTADINCEIHYSYDISEETLFTPNPNLDSHILQHKPINNIK